MDDKENINFIFQLNNKNRSSNYFMLFILSGIVFVGATFYFVAINQTIALISSIVIAIAYFIGFTTIKPSFFELLITETQLQFNFYSVSSTIRNYQSIEMPIHQLKGFHIEESLKGIKKNLILSVESKYGIADYPPISVSILTKKELSLVIHVLNKVITTDYKK
jgi:hypothetical protein